MKIIVLISFLINFIIADYASDIQPIFDANCTNCHGYPNQYGNLVLFSYNDLMSSGTVIPGNAASSSLYDRITREESESGDMPPTGSLSDEDIQLIEAWINNGANETDSEVFGCIDSNAITCDDEIDTLYFPECSTCSDGLACDNYYNPEATADNGLCMYNDVPMSEEVILSQTTSGINIDWSAFTPPVDVDQYVLQRCLDSDGDSDGDGSFEYELCTMIITPNSFYLQTSFIDEFELENDEYLKYTLYVHYPNNSYWGSAFGYYYYELESECTAGDLNGDTLINVQDIVSLVNAIFNPDSLSDTCAADLNQDGTLNVQDIVSLVSLILSI